MKKRLGILLAALCVFSLFMLPGCKSEEAERQQLPPSEIEFDEGTPDKGAVDPFYVLVVGNDTRVGTVDEGKSGHAAGPPRSDTIMLVRVDPGTYKISLVTVSRDTGVYINGEKHKLNTIYQNSGIEALVTEIEALTGANIAHYLDMDFAQFVNFVNELGGVQANVPVNMSLKDIVGGEAVSLAAGEQDLNGAGALVLARTRGVFAYDLDACRQIQDRQLVEAAIRKVLSDPLAVAEHVDTLLGNMDTDWDAEELLATVTNFIENADKVTFVSGTGPYAGDFDPEARGDWLATRDEATWHALIDLVSQGGDPNELVALPNVVFAG